MASSTPKVVLEPQKRQGSAIGASAAIEAPSAQSSPASARWVSRLLSIAQVVGVGVALVGAGHLIAWLSGYMAERGLSSITMKANAALGLLVAGSGLILVARTDRRRAAVYAARGLAVFAFLLGALTLFENLTDWNLGIDELLAQEPYGSLGTTGANRMGIPASGSFVLAGLCLLSLTGRKERAIIVAQWLALALSLIALFACIGYLYEAQSFYAITRLTAVAWPTAASLLALGLGLLFARPAEGLMAQVTADDPGGVALRRWPPVLLLPILLGWLRLTGERLGVFDAATGTAIVMILVIITLAVVAFRGAVLVSRSSAAIVDSEERLRLAHEAAAIGAFDWDIRKGTSVWTAELEGIHGLAPGTFKGNRQAWEELVHPDDRQSMSEKVDQSLRSGNTVESEWRVVWPDGSVHWIAGRWRVLRDAAGNPIRMTGVNLEITERKRMQEALETSIQNLERSNRELEQFAYICAHDLQEPLRQVQLFVQLLQKRCAASIDGQAAEYLGYVFRGAQRMNDLIAGVLAYSRIGYTDTLEERAHCGYVLETAIGDLSAAISESGARITHDELPVVRGSRMQLTQLFQNLISNAIKFRRDGVAPQIHVGCRDDGGVWVFSVEDNGIGIPGEFQGKVFRIFQRLHGHEKYRGTGIGLAVCKKIVEAHGGRIWIEPATGQGSRFCFTLPGNGPENKVSA